MTHVVRVATIEDVDRIAELEAELFGPDAWSPEQIRSDVESPRHHVVVAADDDKVVGYAVTIRTDDVADLSRIAVAAAEQGKGVSWTLLEAVQREARVDGASRMMLEVSTNNESARALYAKAGFIQIDRRARYYRDGSDALVLRVSLGTAACGARGTWGGNG